MLDLLELQLKSVKLLEVWMYAFRYSEEDLDTSLHVTLVTESVTATSKTKINNYNIFCVLIERVVAIFY